MEAPVQHTLLDISPYRDLFPAALSVDQTIKRGATVADTVRFIPRVVVKTRWQVKKYVNRELKGLSTYDACQKLWHFIKDHIRYKKDKTGREQIRSPRRLIHDLVGDCDCFTTFISCCLSWLEIPVIHRITKYGEDFYQHIYPIVPLADGSYITMDCVVGHFNYEEPYTAKKDYPMDLEFLDGIDHPQYDYYDELGALKLFGKEINLKKAVDKVGDAISNAAEKVADVAKDAIHAVNVVNPVTLLLRAGVLASMKLNILNVAGRLKWSYLSDEAAAQKRVDKGKFDQLKKVRERLESIFYGAGGKPENLKEAILTGNGNKDKAVSGLGQLTSLDDLLGINVFTSESFHELYGLGELGEPVSTAASLTAAAGAMAIIADLLKKIGVIFPGGAAENKDFENAPTDTPVLTSQGATIQSALEPIKNLVAQIPNILVPATTPAAAAPVSPTIVPISTSAAQTVTVTNPPVVSFNQPFTPPSPIVSASNTQFSTAAETDASSTSDTQEGFWQQNKSWLKPTLIVGGGLSSLTLAWLIYRASTKPDASAKRSSTTLQGVKPKRKRSKKEHLSAIPLM